MELYNQQDVSVCNYKDSDKKMERQILYASVEGGH